MNKTKDFLQSSLSLAIAANVGAGIMANVVGGSVGSTIDGRDITRRSALTIFVNRLTSIATLNQPLQPVIGLLPQEADPAISMAFDSAASLAEAGQTVVPVENTPLNAIYGEAMRAVSSLGLSQEGTLEERAKEYYEVLTNLMYSNEATSSTFTTSEELIRLGTEAVGSLTALCQAHINPFINEAIAATQKRFKSLYIESASAYSVREQYLFGLLKEQVFVNHVEGFADKTAILNAGFSPLIGVSELTSEYTKSLLFTGVNAFDTAITESLADTDSVERARGLIVNGAGNLNSVFAGSNLLERTRDMVAVFLILRAMSLNDYQVRLKAAGYNEGDIAAQRTSVLGILGQVARRLVDIVEAYKQQVQSNELVEMFLVESGRNYVTVNGEVYQKTLKQVEESDPFDVEAAMLAVAFTGNKNIRYVVDLINNKDNLLSAYRIHRAEMEAANHARLVSTAQQALHQGIRAEMSKALSSFDVAKAYALTTLETEESFLMDGEMISRYSGAIGEHLKKLTISGPDDFEWVVVNTICSVFYPKTDALAFFKLFDAVGKNTPELESREIAAIACIEYIVKWLAASFNVVSSK